MPTHASRIVAVLLMLQVATASANAAGDRVIVRDSRVCQIFALRGTVLYDRAHGGPGSGTYCGQRWTRIVNGRKLGVHSRLPVSLGRIELNNSIGIDARGRVVLTFSTGRVNHSVWWIYDVAADADRRVQVRVPKGCSIYAVAVWRTRIAYTRTCGQWWIHPTRSGHFLRTGTRERRLARYGSWTGQRLVIRGSTVAGFGIDDGDDISVARLGEGNRGCPTFFDFGSAWGDTPRDVWLASDRLIWVNATAPDSGFGLIAPSVWSVAMPGTCRSLGTPTELYAIPDLLHAQAVAVDAPYLYYADDTAIYRRRLSGL